MANYVAIIDSGGSNIASLTYALNRIGAESIFTSNIDQITNASHIILPGVGSASAAMRKLSDNGLTKILPKLTQPVLGICLGMQLMCTLSEEDNTKCLDIIPDKAFKLQATPETTVPNMGWCKVNFENSHPLFEGINNDSWFYFIHSFALPVTKHTLATASHSDNFSAVINKDNYYATQFHPERSAESGSIFLKNFIKIKI